MTDDNSPQLSKTPQTNDDAPSLSGDYHRALREWSLHIQDTIPDNWSLSDLSECMKQIPLEDSLWHKLDIRILGLGIPMFPEGDEMNIEVEVVALNLPIGHRRGKMSFSANRKQSNSPIAPVVFGLWLAVDDWLSGLGKQEWNR